MNALNIRSWSDVRAFLYVLLPVVSTILVSHKVFNDVQASLWSGLVTTILGSGIAFFHAKSVSSFRAFFYGLLGTAQSLAIVYNLATQATIDSWLPLVIAFVGLSAGGVAAANTTTTPNVHASPEV